MITIEQITKGPKALFYCYHITTALRELGGSGATTEVINKIVELFPFTEEVLTKEHHSGSNVFKATVSFAKHYMTKTGYIDSSRRGIWSLTKLGYDTAFNNIDDIATLLNEYEKYVSLENSKYSNQNSVDTNQQIIKKEKKVIAKVDELHIKLTEILRNLNPFGFERLVQRLLREAGFTKVEVTRKTNDGGIDGIGFYPLNHFVSLKLMFQCKRFTGTISSPMIRDFRGAITGRADKGLFITTSYFSNEAYIEANRDGVTHIELIDNDKLFEIFKETGLGFSTDKSTIDNDFFNDYK